MLKKLLVFTLLTTAAFSVFAQQQSEEQLVERADELFAEEKFSEAFPMYSQLVSLHPQSPVYNFKFGACAIYAGEGQSTSLKHLNFAIQKGVSNPLAYYYLGRAHHLNYEFPEAIKAYRTFEKKADSKLLRDYELEALIEQCEFGKGLLSGIKEVVVMEKTEASIDDYFRYYNLEDIGGRMLKTPEELLSRLDKKKDYRSTIHYSGESGEIYFPSYGNDEDTGTDIYHSTLLPDGKWSNPEKLEGFVNTDQNEDFAFFHPDGKTLYFSSKGHNSMGGFDIFKSTYNEAEDSFGPPENMDFAINTPADDIFYIVDKDRNTAYFASGRNSGQNNLNVYKVRVQSIPLNVVVIEGDFVSEIDPSQKEVSIRVLESSSGKELSTAEANKSTGEYELSFERSGNYTLEVEVPNSPYVHTAKIRIPEFENPVLVSQKMRLVDDEGTEKLMVDNLFDNPKELDLENVSLDMIRQKAGLDVNASDDLISEINNRTDQDANLAVQAGFESGTTTEGVLSEMKSEQEQLQAEAEAANEKSASLVALAAAKREQSDSLLSEVSELREQLNKEDKSKYLSDLFKISQLMSEAKSTNREAASALELSKETEEYAKELRKSAGDLKQNIAAIESVEKSENEDKLLDLLTEEHSRKTSTDQKSMDPASEALQAKTTKEEESQQLYEEASALRNDMRAVMRDLEVKRSQLERNPGKKEKEEISLRVDQLESELEILESDIVRKKQRAAQLDEEAKRAAVKSELYESSKEALFADFDAPENMGIAQRDEVSSELEKVELKTAELDFSEEESFVLASDEMKFTRNDIIVEQLIEKKKATAGFDIKSSSELRESFESFKAELESSSDAGQQAPAELMTEIENHIDYWEEQKQKAESEERSGIDSEIKKLELLKASVELFENESASQLAENRSEEGNSEERSGNAGSSSETSDNQSRQDENSDEDSSEEVIETTEENDVAEEQEYLEETSETKNKELNNGGGEERIANTDESELPKTNDSETRQGSNSDVADLNLESEKVKSIANELTEAESLADYDARSQQLIQLDNQVKEQLESTSNPAKRDSLQAVRDEIKSVQFDLDALDELYRSQLAEIQIQNSARRMKTMQESELQRKMIQLLDKKIFLLETYEASGEETPFSADQKSQQLEKRKFNSHNRMNALRAEMSGGERAEPIEIADNQTVENTTVSESGDEQPSDTNSPELRSESVSEPIGATELTVNIATIEPEENDVESVYETSDFEELYAKQAGLNLRFRNEDDISELKDEIAELKNTSEGGSGRTEKKLKRATEKLSKEEAENATKVRRMVEQAIGEFEDVIATQKRSPNEQLSEAEAQYVERLEEVNSINLVKADSLRSLAMNEPDQVMQNKLYKKAHVYELRVLEGKEAVAEMYENRSWNEELVSREQSETEQLADRQASPTPEPAGQEKLNVEDKDSSEPIAENLFQKRDEVDDSSLTDTTESAPLDDKTESPIADEFDADEEAKKLLEAEVTQREALEEELVEKYDLSEVEIRKFRQSSVFASYSDKLKNVKTQQVQLNEELETLEENQQEYASLNRQIKELETELESTGDETEKAEIREELVRLRVEAEVTYKEMRDKREEVQAKATMLSAAIVEADANYKQLISGFKPKATSSLNNASAADISRLKMPKQLNENIFARSEKSVYSDENPIPKVKENEMPDGIVYQVQVGAFRNPIPQNHFSEFAPVMAHDLNNGITRYTVGLFNQVDAAQQARDQVRSLGYSDAFIVAYKNGERVSVDAARAQETDTDLAANPELNSSRENETEEAPEERVDESSDAAPATPVSEISGVFFTVQVGVFSNPVSRADLNNLTPLNRDRTASGMLRYTTGVFDSYNAADQRKEAVRQTGITDAFVTAYYNGERIGIDRARQLAGSGSDRASGQNERFDVLIGRFENQVPSNVARAMLMLENRYGVEQEVIDGKTEYSTREVKTRLEAERIQEAFRDFDVDNTQIRSLSGN